MICAALTIIPFPFADAVAVGIMVPSESQQSADAVAAPVGWRRMRDDRSGLADRRGRSSLPVSAAAAPVTTHLVRRLVPYDPARGRGKERG